MIATEQVAENQPAIKRHHFLELLDRHLEGRLTFLLDGSPVHVGRGRPGLTGSDATLQVHDRRFFGRVLAAGNLGLGEAYMARDFEMVEGTLEDFLILLLRSRLDEKITADPLSALRILGTRVYDILRGKQQNIKRHYDIGDDLFELFLDSSLTYSCGYAHAPTDDVETLQRNKLERICQKLRLAPGERLLDIGCGYGGLLTHAAKHHGVTGVGVTISRHHCDRGNANIAAAGLADRIEIRFQDHTTLDGTFDKVVSVGMMEHVPRREYRRYFTNIARMLTPKGYGLVHTIGCNGAVNHHDPFIQKYIFPGSNQPRLSEITENLEKCRLAIVDVENMVRHYAVTGRRWLEAFRARADQLDKTKYDETFRRMWEYYLACGVAGMTASDTALYQVVFTKDYAADLSLQRV
ncbi:MAG TPA: class I SAM-dependent methyltransferase [Kofleriaceae bacterium]|nr:class I SAM-dependent methyltransferase [Kofleriaceae bacterium]